MKKIIALSAVLSIYCFAQDVVETKLQKTLVSATGFEEEIGSESRSIHIIDKESFSNKGYTSVEEILQQAPSITFSDSGFGNEIDLRGQGKNAKTHVKVMIDGVVTNGLDNSHGLTPYDTIDIEDIERIEIIPGGGSVLYGSGTKGGVVNIITKQSLRDFFANLYVKGGAYESNGNLFGQYGASVGKKIIDSFYIKGSIQAFNEKTHIENEEENGFYGSLDANYLISDAQKIRMKGSYYQAEIAQAPLFEKSDPNPNTNSIVPTNATNTRYDALMEYQNNFNKILEANLMGFYRHSKMEYDKGVQKGSYFEDNIFGLNTKLKWYYGASNNGGNFIVGYDLSNQEALTSSLIFDKKSASIETNKLSNSLFFVERHDFSQLFSLLLGMRYEYALYDISRERYKNNMFDMGFDGKRNSNNYAYEITPTVSYSDTGKIYTKYERGFISPTPSQLVNTHPTRGFEFNGIKSEVYDTVEIGIKEQSDYILTSLSTFYTSSKDMIFQDAQGSHGVMNVIYSNIDKTRHIGAELSVEGDWDFISAYISGSLINAKIVEGKDSGKEIPLVPAYKISAGADYELLKNLNIFGNVTLYGDSKTTTYETIDSYVLTNIGAKSRLMGLRVDAGVRNLFDVEYNTYENATSYRPGAGRNYYIEARYSF